MSQRAPLFFSDPEACAEAILRQVGKRVVLGMPLGLGKANHIANALYARAKADKLISLEILTALTLGIPRGQSELERRLLQPFFERLAGDYPSLAYDGDQRRGRLPRNVAVHEFFLPAGRRLNDAPVQQSYISSNYTHVARDSLARGVNVAAQLVARHGQGDSMQLSMSCNPDVALDLAPALRERRKAGEKIAIAAQINDRLPFMTGQAQVSPDEYDFVLDSPQCQFSLFPVPKQPVDLASYASALRTSALIEDGGTLQIGIGQFADALSHGLILRHTRNAEYRDLMRRLGHVGPDACLEPFREGLYASSEMLVEGLLALKRAGIVKRRPAADANGKTPMIHAAFFLGAKFLYDQLREFSDAERDDIAMCAVSFVNQLYGDEQLKRAQRVKARFVNNALLVTLLGSVASDALEDGRVVSGVGGQYNFVAMAHELEGARSIITLDATHHARGRTISNVVWSYGHATIPRHLRDMVVTEYGIADLRGKSDREVIAAMLNVADSRFQSQLLGHAKKARKIETSYRIPDAHRGNAPARIQEALMPARRQGLLPDFPLGSDMDATEMRLTASLVAFKPVVASPLRAIPALARAARAEPTETEREGLKRMGLHKPRFIKERVLAWTVLAALRAHEHR